MKKRIIDVISIISPILVEFLIVKYFYFDTQLGYSSQIINGFYTSFPIYVYVILDLIIYPFFIWGIVQQLGESLNTMVDKYKYRNRAEMM